MGLQFYVFVRLLIITCLFHEFNFQSVTVSDQCSPEEVSAIIREHADLFDVKIANSSLVIQQQIIDTKNKITQSSEFLQLQKVLSQIKATLNNLKQEICTTNLQLQFDLKSFKIDVLQSNCLAISIRNEQTLQSKTNKALKKSESVRAKVALALQKCAIANSLSGCSFVRTCCQQVVTKSTNKIDSKQSKIDNRILTAMSEQNDCLRNVAIEALLIEDNIREALLQCRLDGYQAENIPSVTISSQESQSNEETNAPSQQAQTLVSGKQPDVLDNTVEEENNLDADIGAKLLVTGKEGIQQL